MIILQKIPPSNNRYNLYLGKFDMPFHFLTAYRKCNIRCVRLWSIGNKVDDLNDSCYQYKYKKICTK